MILLEYKNDIAFKVRDLHREHIEVRQIHNWYINMLFLINILSQISCAWNISYFADQQRKGDQ